MPLRYTIYSCIDVFNELERNLDNRDSLPVNERVIQCPIVTDNSSFSWLLKGNKKDLYYNGLRRKYSGRKKLLFHKSKLKEKLYLGNNVYHDIYFRQFSVSSIVLKSDTSLQFDDKSENSKFDLSSKGSYCLSKEKDGRPSSKSKNLVEEKLCSTFRDDVTVMKNKTSSVEENKLTHIDEKGAANMVDVGGKNVSHRQAIAQSVLWVGKEAGTLILENNVKKGDVFGVARIAGIMAAKSTASLIPLCHQVPLSSVKVDLFLDTNTWEVVIHATALCEGKTGVEMEALVAASIAALTVYDMVKSVAGRSGMAIKEVRLVSKVGGQKGDYYYKG